MDNYVITNNDLDEYTKACFNAASIFFWNDIQAIITPIRGAKPIVELVKFILDKAGKEFVEYPVMTSGFVHNRENVIYVGLQDVFQKELERKEFISLMFPDAFISGSALKGFKKKFSGNIVNKLINNLDLRDLLIEMTYVAFKQDYVIDFELVNKHKKEYSNNVDVNFKTYSLGLGKIITEDKPPFLGIDYPFVCEGGSKLPIISEVKEDNKLFVKGSSLSSDKKYVSEQFLDIAKQVIVKNYF